MRGTEQIRSAVLFLLKEFQFMRGTERNAGKPVYS